MCSIYQYHDYRVYTVYTVYTGTSEVFFKVKPLLPASPGSNNPREDYPGPEKILRLMTPKPASHWLSRTMFLGRHAGERLRRSRRLEFSKAKFDSGRIWLESMYTLEFCITYSTRQLQDFIEGSIYTLACLHIRRSLVLDSLPILAFFSS